MKLPSFFFATGDCGCGTAAASYVATPATPGTATICDDRYYTMVGVPNGTLLVIAPGTNCQAKLTEGSANGLVVSRGAGLGFAPTVTPELALPTLAAASNAVFPQILVATGSGSTTPWKALTVPASGTWYLTATTGGWTLTDATSLPSLINLFAAASNGTELEMVGFVQTGTTGGGQPIFEARKLIGSGSGTQPLVLQYDGTSGRYEVKAASSGTGYAIGALQITTLAEQIAGVATAGGFSIRPNSGITQTDIYLLAYDTGTGRVYRAPSHDRKIATSTTAQTLTLSGSYQSYPGHLQPTALTVNYPQVEVNFDVKFESHEQPIFGLFCDGVLVFEWVYDGVIVDPNTQFSGSWIHTAVTLGARTYDIRVKGASSTKLEFSTMTVKTLPS